MELLYLYKAQISCAVTMQLLCAFVFAYVKSKFISATSIPAGHGNLSALRWLYGIIAYLNV